MIKINDKEVSSVFDEVQEIEKIMKGTLLVFESLKNLIASGVPPLTLLKSGGKDLVNYKLYGESVQETQPTPDTPVEVESVGDYDETTGKYKIPVKVIGKNMLNIDDLLNAPSGIVNGIAVKNLLTLKLKPNTDYTMSSDAYGSLDGAADKSRCLYFHGTSNTVAVFKGKSVTTTTGSDGTLRVLLLSDRTAAQSILNKGYSITYIIAKGFFNASSFGVKNYNIHFTILSSNFKYFS